MTTTPPPTAMTDSDRISRVEGVLEQQGVRLDNLERSLDSLRTMMFMGFGLLWATMVAGYITLFVAIINGN